MEVVGVCDDVKQFRLDADPTADVYVPLGQMPSSQTSFLAARMYWVLNTDVDPMAVADLVRGQVRRLDKDVATSSTRAMSAIVALSIGSRRFNTHPHGNRGVATLLLALVGVHSVTTAAATSR